MPTKLFAIAALVFAACATDEVPQPTDEVQLLAEAEPLEYVEACERVVDTEGPCAYACDAEKVFSFVPEGQCVTFVCHLDNGERLLIGGCR